MPNYLIDEKKNFIEENTPVLIKKSLNIGTLDDDGITLSELTEFITELNTYFSQIYAVVFRSRFGTYVCTDYEKNTLGILTFKFPRESDNLLASGDTNKLGYLYIALDEDKVVLHVYDSSGNEYTKIFREVILDFYILA